MPRCGAHGSMYLSWRFVERRAKSEVGCWLRHPPGYEPLLAFVAVCPPPPPAPPISLSAFSSHCCSALQIDKYKVRRCKIRCVCVFWTKELEFNFRCDQDCMLVVTLGCFVLARNLLIGGNFGRLRNKSWSVRDAEFVELYGTAKRRVWNLKKLYRPLKWK